MFMYVYSLHIIEILIIFNYNLCFYIETNIREAINLVNRMPNKNKCLMNI